VARELGQRGDRNVGARGQRIAVVEAERNADAKAKLC
jgi:hypothetical protein